MGIKVGSGFKLAETMSQGEQNSVVIFFFRIPIPKSENFFKISCC